MGSLRDIHRLGNGEFRHHRLPGQRAQRARSARRVLRPYIYGDNGSGDFTSVYQPLDIVLDDYAALDLSLDVMVIWHNLQAGGWSQPSFEWPVVAQIAYLDDAGTVRFWRYGWYVMPPGDGYIIDDPGDDLIPVYNDRLVTAGVWASGQFDLLQELPPQAVKVLGLLVGGSGWKFQGCADNVSLQGTLKPLEVVVDIKPGSLPNSINPRNKGVIPVAILGTATFDVLALDGASVRLVRVPPRRSTARATLKTSTATG